LGSANYNIEDIKYIEDKWGTVAIGTMAKELNRSVNAILIKKTRMGLGAFLENGEYITVNQFFKAIGRNGCWTYTLNHWIEKGFPVKKKKVNNCRFKVIYLEEFWKWAKEYRMHIDFAKFKENTLGAEPNWVKEQRIADIEFAKYKVSPWTKEEDNQLKSLLKLYRYTYKELSLALLRTDGAIKRRMVDLCLMERPLREPPHSIWTDEQVNVVVDMYKKGYRNVVISEHIDKSGQAINGKIERLIRDGVLAKWK
jgi:hypothetical protein